MTAKSEGLTPRWNWPRMIAHRGGGILAPENTIAGLAAALGRGYRAVEFDVMLAADGIPVLMHDERLGRTVAGRGWVPELSSAALCAMDAGSWFGPAFAGERVPLYQDALEFCLAHKLWMNVEIKPAAGHEAQTGTAVASLTREWLGADAAGQVLFSSFSPLALQAAQAAAPDIARAWLLTKLPADWLARAQALRLSSVHLNHRQLNAESSARIRERGYGLFCYTVNTQSAWQRLAALGVDAICTDRIDLFPADAFALAAG